MAGRGRGRGRGMSFGLEVLGFGRGETLPPPILQPPPLFPPLEFKPLPLSTGDNWEYLVALKQEFHGSMKDSPYFIKPADTKKDIERYSDKYQLGSDNNNNWLPDWNRLPKELKSSKQTHRRKRPTVIKPTISAAKKTKVKTEDITKTLEELEKKEDGAEDEEEGEKDKEEEEGEEINEEDEYYDEEDVEEGTDYILSYFDNGENYLDEEDDNLDDGPTYY